NIIGTLNILTVCRATNAHYIGVETGRHWPSPYAITKATAAEFSNAYARTFGLRTSILRVFNAYGPRQKGTGAVTKIVPRFAVNLMRGEPVPVFGDGSQAVDLIWAPDVADCFARAIENLP